MLNIQKLLTLGIDTAEGLACCADDEEFYEEMLAEYISEAEAGISELERSFDTKDWKSYGIRAHTVKSTSRMVGAQELSELARVMETAAKTGDEETLLRNHRSFIDAFLHLEEGIRGSLY